MSYVYEIEEWLARGSKAMLTTSFQATSTDLLSHRRLALEIRAPSQITVSLSHASECSWQATSPRLCLNR